MLKAAIFFLAVTYCSASDAVVLSYNQYVALEAAINAIKKTNEYQKRNWSFGAYEIRVEPSDDGYLIWFTAPHIEVDSASPQVRSVRHGSSFKDKFPSLVVYYDLKKAKTMSVRLQK